MWTIGLVTVLCFGLLEAAPIASNKLSEADKASLDLDMPFLIFSLGGPLREAFELKQPKCMPWIEQARKRFSGKLNDLYESLSAGKNKKLMDEFMKNCESDFEAYDDEYDYSDYSNMPEDYEDYFGLANMSDDDIDKFIAENYL